MSTSTTFAPTYHDLPSTHRAYPTRGARKLNTLASFHPASNAVRSTDAGSWHAPADDDSDAASIKSTSTSSSSIRFADTTPLKAIPRPLLQLASPRPHSIASVASPRSPEYLVTPTFGVDKRKKMNKVTRTMGSKIPPEVVFSKAADAKMLPSKKVVPSLLSALSPAHERELVKTKADKARQSQLSSRSTGEAGLSPYAYSTHHSGSRSATSFQSASSGSASNPNSPYTPSSNMWPSSSYAASPARSPHYVKVSRWNPAPDARGVHHEHGRSKSPGPTVRPSTSSRSTDDSRYFSRYLEVTVPLNPAPDARGDHHEHGRSKSPGPTARPSTSSRSTDDSRYFSRYLEVAVPPYAASMRSPSPSPSTRSPSPSRSASPLPRSSTSTSNYSRDSDEGWISTHRKEAGWSGEWSGARGMGDVVNKLRGLRFK
ncbi:hypothetical protein B0H16DRAFT_1571031 [Mycena metata]|uniref:Uncharacterized protein n=1 Tax=Mycena metata TaxID=1033252 RepID=A0AAD7I9L0_9AGAR|nr:hypothetical protein B0H16DRAFT_1571031 [Mycena metata]